MENENNSNKDLSTHTTDQENATDAERRSLTKSKIFIIESTSDDGQGSSTRRTNPFREEAMEESNGILKEATASESIATGVDDTENRDNSVRECKEDDAVTKITVVDELNETPLEEFPSDGSKREMKNPRGKIGDMATTDRHRCQRPLRDIIGKREQRREELDKMEGDMRQRLDMLECSIPAVMMWNIWRMSQGASGCRLKRILEKQFKDTKKLSCRSTPSCHYDCRVREVEAERKLALRKVQEARSLWSEKLATLEERKRKLDKARRIQEEQKSAIERLNEETRVLQETMEKKTVEEKALEMDLCQYSDAQCKQRHLGKICSMMSVDSGDIQCLEKLQRLAEEEVTMKREIVELERREEAYMRTLQQADELWSKMEGDRISTTSGLQEQLDMKTAANQQLANRVCELEDAHEKCRARLATCRAELEKFLSIEKVEAMIGRDDDVAKVVDKEVAVRAKVVHRSVGRADDVATVKDAEVLASVEIADEEILAKTEVAECEALARVEIADEEMLAKTEVADGEALARVEVEDGETLARVEVEDGETLARVVLADADVETALVVEDKFISVKPELADLAVDRPVDLVQIEDVESVVRPEDIAHEQQRFQEVQEYLSKLDSLEELYKDEGEPCPPDFVCVADDMLSLTGMTDEELISLGVKYVAPEEVVSDEEREKQFREELATRERDVIDIEKKEKKEDEIPGVEIERKVVEKMEKRVGEIADVPVTETVTPRIIEEEAVDDRLVTMPEDRAPEVYKIEADRGIVIQRDTILSWLDSIDTIRMTAAKHRDYHEVKKDADILAEQVGTYVGVKPKEVKEENGIITEEKAKEMEPVRKIESVLSAEETPAEVQAIAEPELLPTLIKEEAPISMEPPTAVSIEDSFQPPTIHDKEDLKEDTVPLFEPDIEKIRAEEARIKDIAQDTKEIEIPKYKIAEKDAVEDLTDGKLINGETVKYIDKEKTLIVPEIEKEEQEVISNHIDRKEERDVPTETKREEIIAEKIDETLPVTEIEEIKFVEELKEIPQVEETKMIDIKKTTSHMWFHMEIIRINEIVQVPSVPEIEEIERKETIPAMDVIEAEEIIPEVISPTVDIIEVEKFEPKFPVEDVEKIPMAVEEIEESVLIKEEIKAELPLTLEKEPTEVTELLPIEDIEKKEDIKPAVPPILEIEKEEKVRTEELSLAEVVPEEIVKTIEPIQPTIKREMEEIEKEEEFVLEVEFKKKVEEITLSEKVTYIELPEKKKEEEMPPVEGKKIPTEVPPFKEPTLKKEVSVEEIKPEVIHVELKIPIAEIKLTEMEMPAIPQLMAQPYLIIAKIKEQEQLQITPAKQPTACCLQPAVIETARPLDVPQPDVLQTEFVQSEVIQANVVQTEMTETKIVRNENVQTEIVETEAVETEVVQITTQTVSESPRTPIRIISKYLKPIELKASRTEIAGDRPEITGRKMLWRKRLKDQSTVTTTSTGSQTDKTSHVSHDRVVRDERERARVPTDELLRSIKIAAGLVRPDTEREIRTINYGEKSEEMGRVACNCCLCGRIPTLPSTGPRLEIQPQIDAKTATPPAVVAFKRMFIRPKIDHPIPHDRLCPDCKAKIQSRMPRENQHVEKIIKKISRDQEDCGCVSIIGKSCRAAAQKRAIEKRDQACLAKMSRRKTNLTGQKRKDDVQSILEDSDKLSVEPLSPSCICFKLEKTGVGPIRKGNCYCAD